MLKKVLDALGALLEDVPVFERLIAQMQAWGSTQQAARQRLVTVLGDVVASFERAHAVVLIELSRLGAADTADDYRRAVARDLDRDRLYELFKANEICEHVHRLHADLRSGFGEISDALVLGAARKLAAALGDFEQGEYTLAMNYQQHLQGALLDALRVVDEDGLREARVRLVDEQLALSRELQELTAFKRRLLQLGLYA